MGALGKGGRFAESLPDLALGKVASPLKRFGAAPQAAQGEPFRPQPRRRRSPPRPAARAAAAAPPEPARPILLRASVTPGVKVAAAAAARQALASSSYPSSGLRRPPNRYAHPFLFPLCFVNLYSDRI